jgi:hypothetical protein
MARTFPSGKRDDSARMPPLAATNRFQQID